MEQVIRNVTAIFFSAKCVPRVHFIVQKGLGIFISRDKFSFGIDRDKIQNANDGIVSKLHRPLHFDADT